jgi:hypothetical protein
MLLPQASIAFAALVGGWLLRSPPAQQCLGHAIAKSGPQSALVENYVDNGKQQERAADSAVAVLALQ